MPVAKSPRANGTCASIALVRMPSAKSPSGNISGIVCILAYLLWIFGK